MKRRTFIQGALSAAAIAPVMLDRVYARPSSPLSLLAQLDAVNNDKILVLVQLFGGNDGLNTVIPGDDVNYPLYQNIRPTIYIDKQQLYNYGGIYMNPGVQHGDKRGFAGMFEVGSLAILQGIGYDKPNLSHFRSTDIWLSGINPEDSLNVVLNTGWLGRFLEQRYPSFPASLPPDPLAINFGGFSLALTSEKGRMGIEVDNPNLQAGGLEANGDAMDDNHAGTRYELEYAFVADVANRSNVYAQRVKSAYMNGKAKLKGNYGSDGFAQQMASVAALIAGGLDTKVYVVGVGGFDTHVNQAGDDHSGTGAHANLLGQVADAIGQFQYDLLQLDQSGTKVSDRVLGLTISEFGRRPHENGSYGTDHGAASVQFVFGTQIAGGVFGQTADLSNFDANGDIPWQIDYRQVYTSLLVDWFGMTLDDARTVLADTNKNLNPLPGLLKAPASVSSPTIESLAFSVYPNPVSSRGNLKVDLPRAGYVTIEMSSTDGKRSQTIMERSLAAGSYTIPFTTDVASGAYLLSIRTGSERVTQLVNVVR